MLFEWGGGVPLQGDGSSAVPRSLLPMVRRGSPKAKVRAGSRYPGGGAGLSPSAGGVPERSGDHDSRAAHSPPRADPGRGERKRDWAPQPCRRSWPAGIHISLKTMRKVRIGSLHCDVCAAGSPAGYRASTKEVRSRFSPKVTKSCRLVWNRRISRTVRIASRSVYSARFTKFPLTVTATRSRGAAGS